MKRIAIAVLALSFTFGGIFSVKTAMADTTNKKDKTEHRASQITGRLHSDPNQKTCPACHTPPVSDKIHPISAPSRFPC